MYSMAKRATKEIVINTNLKERLERAHEKVKATLDLAIIEGIDISPDLQDLMRMADASATTGYDMRTLSMASLSSSEIEELSTPKYKLTFTAHLTSEDITRLLPVMNEKIFANHQTSESVRLWLECRQPQPVRVKNGKKLAYLMRLLAGKKKVCSNWQKVADTNKVFAFNESGKIITSKYLSKTLSQAKKGNVFSSYDVVFDEDIKNTIESL